YEIFTRLEFRRVLFRSPGRAGCGGVRAVVGSRAGGQAQRGYKAEGADEVSDASSHVRVPLMGSWLVGRATCGPGVRGATLHPERSEERRVGKECRSRWG